MNGRPVWPLLIAVLLIAHGMGLFSGGSILPDDRPLDIDVDRPAALFAINFDEIEPAQAQVAASMIVKKYADENGIDWRKYDVEQDMAGEEKHWREMMAAAENKSRLVTANDDGGKVEPIPSTVDQAKEILGGLK